MCSAARQPVQHPHKDAALYRPRHPEQTQLVRTIAGHFETWLELASVGQFDGQGDHHTPAAYVVQAFRKYLARNLRPWFCARPLWRLRTRFPDRLFLQGARRLPVLQ